VLMVNSSNMFSISKNLEVVMILPFCIFSELRLNMESHLFVTFIIPLPCLPEQNVINVPATFNIIKLYRAFKLTHGQPLVHNLVQPLPKPNMADVSESQCSN